VSQPSEKSTTITRTVAGFVHWKVHDDRLDFRSDAYGVPTPAGLLLIDPLPLAETALANLPEVAGILLTAGCHQRAAWQLRDRLEAPVMAPEGAELDELPDAWLEDGSRPANDVTSRVVTGPSNPHLVILWESDPRVLFVGDLLMRDGDDSPFAPVPATHHEDYGATRLAVAGLLACAPDWLCPAHGAASANARSTVEAALAAWPE